MNAWGGDFAPLPRVPVGSGARWTQCPVGASLWAGSKHLRLAALHCLGRAQAQSVAQLCPLQGSAQPLVELQRRSSTSGGRPGHSTGAVCVEPLS